MFQNTGRPIVNNFIEVQIFLKMVFTKLSHVNERDFILFLKQFWLI